MTKQPMKNLFFGSMRNKQMFTRIIALVVFASVISFVLYEGTKKSVAIDADGEQLEVSTHAKTVADVLADANIEVADYDKVSPSLDTEISNGLEIKWEQAKKFVIAVDGEEKEVWTTEEKVADILADADVTVTEHDKLSVGLDEQLAEGQAISIDKAFGIVLVDGNKKEQKIWSTKQTVADVLKQNNVKLNEFDRLNTKETALVAPGSKVAITRVEKKVDTVQEEIDFAVEQKNDANLAKGEQKVVAEGAKGTIERTYEVVTENGKIVAKNLQKENVTKEPTKKVVAIGTKEAPKAAPVTVSRGATSTNDTSGAPAGGREFYVEATAYTAYCDGCSGITATGIDIRSNPGIKVIAVDPNVIPLGSRVWVEGYGYAIAGDTGGVIKGNIIDLLVSSKEEAANWGRRQVRIKVLN
ncbi:Cell wall-binding protein YocH precursor [Metalysinibacillus saudimassiliensis]|uniref:Cell wall-binding protein YocH n=1 Tax=Metalysinibacillus saudimassiliensis TaxID=1461583 RepID=A0A078LWH7_9BACL|nr:Cell wall-binding protein YocH precursor [Metalysinibacillus saudimassiliensis]